MTEPNRHNWAIPRPAHPHKRRSPLPWHAPKPAEEGVIDPEDRELFWYAERPQQIWEGILRWHEANGEPLFG